MMSLLPPVLRMLFPGRCGRFVFARQAVAPSRPEALNLYIHVPFCRHVCPFCPYVKQTYDRSTADAYRVALLRELDAWQTTWQHVPVTSLYFGGGTPSMTPDIIEAVMSQTAGDLQPGAEVGVEVHPLDARPDVLKSLRSSGVTMVSLGVQSFNDRLLHTLGRDYDERVAREACGHALAAGFDAVDIDLIFAIPGQSLEEAAADVAAALGTGAAQVSAYPLIQFSDTPLAGRLASAGVRLPSRRTERRMLQAAVRQARETGYERSSIWSFNRPGAPRYTTVTRDAFIGIGAGASSRMGDWFWLNTFSVPEYIRVAGNGGPPALATRLNDGDRMAYWLFWRCYDTAIDTARFRALFGHGMPLGVRAALALMRTAALARREGDTTRLTDRGAYLFHLVEQMYTHAYLEPLWAACRKEAWPDSVRL